MKRVFSLLLISFTLACQTAREVPYKNVAPDPGPDTQLNELAIIDSYEFSRSQIGFVLFDPESRSVLRALGATRSFIPASVTKILTTAAALRVLGPSHRFATRVALSRGDLYLIGSGDPRLHARDLMKLAERTARVRRSSHGQLFYDDFALPQTESINPRNEAAASYNAGLSALSLDFNQKRIFWRPDPMKPETALAAISPSFAGLPITQSETDSHHEVVYERTSWGLNFDLVSGKDSERVPSKNPGQLTASVFQNFAKIHGMNLPHPERKKAPPSLKTIARHLSPPLIEIAQANLEYSNNVISELLLLATARKLLRRAPVSLREAAETVAAWWRKQIPTLQWDGFQLANGSGLTSDNRISPVQLVQILRYIEKRIPGYYRLVPLSGSNGTLKSRMGNPRTSYRVWAKTGTLDFVSSLSGWVFAESGKRYLFAILTADQNARESYEESHDRGTKRAARFWRKKARSIQDHLLAKWIAEL